MTQQSIVSNQLVDGRSRTPNCVPMPVGCAKIFHFYICVCLMLSCFRRKPLPFEISEWSAWWNKRQSFFRRCCSLTPGSWISHPDHNRWSKQISQDEPPTPARRKIVKKPDCSFLHYWFLVLRNSGLWFFFQLLEKSLLALWTTHLKMILIHDYCLPRVWGTW